MSGPKEKSTRVAKEILEGLTELNDAIAAARAKAEAMAENERLNASACRWVPIKEWKPVAGRHVISCGRGKSISRADYWPDEEEWTGEMPYPLKLMEVEYVLENLPPVPNAEVGK